MISRMGLTGELVRSVFSKNRSVGSHDNHMRSYGNDKRRWSSVRSYLCGDEFNSVLAEEDSASASVRSSEATVTQLVVEDVKGEDSKSEVKEAEINEERALSSIEENAATVIQSAFRGFMVRQQNVRTNQMDTKEIVQGVGSPSRESVGTSIEVQTAGSIEVLTVQEERALAQRRLQQKARAHVSKLKEDWDDSTVSSNISKLRIQNRLEASTRRERAMAYAFSQQLRICSKKRPTQSETSELNMGWSWLERWMATRPPENFLVEDRMSKQHEPISRDQRSGPTKKGFDLASEEKESCGSNEVPVGIESITFTTLDAKDGYKPVKNRLKAKKAVSQCKTVPSYQCSTQLTKAVNKKDGLKEAEKDGKHKQTLQPQSIEVTKDEDASPRTMSSSEQQ